ncbi:excalibur calcium-binding domain-containing protein [Candidatus Neomicrothrix sp.]|uniref:excalibur calcium-binding domain-containing protein n=1 Tax=Candidatus Neomicrothrix sp. TaxID=2719034 RepID=UPI003CD0C7AD
MLAMLAGLAAGPDDATGNDRIQEVRAVQRTTTTERVGPTSTAAAPTTARATTTVAPTTTAPPPSTTTPPPPTTAPPPPTPAPTAAPIPTTEYAPPPPMPVAAPLPEIGSGSYKNCSAARAAGAAPVYRNDPGYGAHLDRDGDGVGCEN